MFCTRTFHFSPTVDVTTDAKDEYRFFSVACGSVRFNVRTPSDAHVSLTGTPEKTAPQYEIFIGSCDNTKTVIRRNKREPVKAEVSTPNILRGNEFLGFWICWDGGRISIGREGEGTPFLSWSDPEPFPIKFVGVRVGTSATGSWKIGDGREFDTLKKLEYRYEPVTEGSVKFLFRGPNDCHVCLANGPSIEQGPIYEIFIGGWGNQKTAIRYCQQQPAKMILPTPEVLDPAVSKTFIIRWVSGRVMVFDGFSNNMIFEWTNPTPFHVTHFGVRTFWGARGYWQIHHFDTSRARD